MKQMKINAFNSLQAPPGDQLGPLMSLVAQQKLTALGQVAAGPQMDLLLVIKDGVVVHGYEGLGRACKRILPYQVDTIPAQNVLIYPLKTSILQFTKILVEQAGEYEASPFSVSQVADLLTQGKKADTATLFHLHWKTADGFILTAGGNIPYWQVAFISPQVALDGDDAFHEIKKWEQGCELTTYQGNLEQEAWLEMHLKAFFNWSINLVLERYGYLTGKLMVASVKREIATYAVRKGWDFSSTSQEMSDRTIFASAEQMTIAYRDAISQIIRHIQGVVGVGMMSIILQQISNNVNGTYQALIRQYRLME